MSETRLASGDKVTMNSTNLDEHPDLPATPATPWETGSRDTAHRRNSPHFREEELAQRWRISPRTLQRWRRLGRAPAHLLLGQRVLYRCEDVEAFERRHRHAGTVE